MFEIQIENSTFFTFHASLFSIYCAAVRLDRVIPPYGIYVLAPRQRTDRCLFRSIRFIYSACSGRCAVRPGGIPLKKSVAIILIIAAFLTGIAVDMAARGMAAVTRPPEAGILAKAVPDSPALRKAREVYAMLQTCYIGEVDEDVMCDSIPAAMVFATGDRWSYYISAEEMQTHQEQVENAYVGVGVTVEMSEDGRCLVVEVNPNGPAFEAGVLPDDIFVSVDGVDCTGMTMTELRNAVRGDEGSTVDITMLRGSEKIDFTIERRRVQTEVVSDKMLGDVGYIAIYNFDHTCAMKTIEAIERVRAQGAKALLFDVRYNPGGLKNELIPVLDYLLPEGVLFRSEDYRGNVSVDRSDRDCVDLPMAVLINQDSYSAAEFFAAALSEFGAAKTVGTQTCGKGYFQTTQLLSDGSAINLSVGKYYTPKGVSLADAGGLTPDVEVELPEEDIIDLASHRLAPEEDEQLQAALGLLQ